MIIWFTGISGVGKTTLAKITYKFLKKKNKNILHIDGDIFRELFANDLKYSLKDRNRNAERIINFVKLLNAQKINVIVSANLTSKRYRTYCHKYFKKFYEINIESDIKNLVSRDKKRIYNLTNKKNVVGFGIKNHKNNTANYVIKNNLSRKILINNFNYFLNNTLRKFTFF